MSPYDDYVLSLSAASFIALLLKRRDKLAREVEALKEKEKALADVQAMIRTVEGVTS